MPSAGHILNHHLLVLPLKPPPRNQTINPACLTFKDPINSQPPHGKAMNLRKWGEHDVELSHKPLPIQLKGIFNFNDFCKKLKKLVGANEFPCHSRLNITTVRPNISDASWGIIKFLKASGLQYYTYHLKEEKSSRVGIWHLHPRTPETEKKKKNTGRIWLPSPPCQLCTPEQNKNISPVILRQSRAKDE